MSSGSFKYWASGHSNGLKHFSIVYRNALLPPRMNINLSQFQDIAYISSTSYPSSKLHCNLEIQPRFALSYLSILSKIISFLDPSEWLGLIMVSKYFQLACFHCIVQARTLGSFLFPSDFTVSERVLDSVGRLFPRYLRIISLFRPHLLSDASFLRILKDNTNCLQVVDLLFSNNLSSQSLFTISRFCNELRVLRLKDWPKSELPSNSINSIICDCRSLRDLSLINCGFSNCIHDLLFDNLLLASHPPTSVVSQFRLTGMDIITLLPMSITNLVCAWPGLEVIELPNLRLKQTFNDAFVAIFTLCRHLRILRLKLHENYSDVLTDNALIQSSSLLPSLSCLSLHNVTAISDKGLKPFICANSELEILSLSFSPNACFSGVISDAFLSDGVSCCEFISSLTLKCMPHISDVGLRAVLSSCSLLEELKIKGCSNCSLEMSFHPFSTLGMRLVSLSEWSLLDLLTIARACPDMETLILESVDGEQTRELIKKALPYIQNISIHDKC